tara:strand:+ start:412 stop:1170 length:759 start_codon:yes stop_codon:yes gene_type:complete
MTITRKALEQYINTYLRAHEFKDYTSNGLQVEGKDNIKTLVTGVTASQALIEQAIEHQADALLVHHGYFWKNETQEIIGMKQKRIKALLLHDINLLAYHLPLDAHDVVGNNRQLAQKLEIHEAQVVPGVAHQLLWRGQLKTPLTAQEFALHIERCLQRPPLCIEAGQHLIQEIAWCTGGAQDYIDTAAQIGVDAFLSGEASERTFHSAIEQNIHYFGAGHHATERYGVEALGAHLQEQFDIKWHHIDIDNPV